MTAGGFRRVAKCHLRRIRGVVLTVRAENATKKGLHDTRKAVLIQCPTPSWILCDEMRRSVVAAAGVLHVRGVALFHYAVLLTQPVGDRDAFNRRTSGFGIEVVCVELVRELLEHGRRHRLIGH